MKKTQRLFFMGIYILMFIVHSTLPVFSQEEDLSEKGREENIMAFMEEGMNEIDYYSLEELLNVEVEVASLFIEDELVVGSTVAAITPEEWRRMGAKRANEALANEMGVMLYSTYGGSIGVSIRGYTSSTSVARGLSFLIDGVPMNALGLKTGIYQIPNWEPGTLKAIEMIKGPGSAIYGEDAFHGVLSFKTFESEKDVYEIEAAGGYPLYGDASVRLSEGFADDFVRINLSAGGSYQGDQNIENEYESGTSFVWVGMPYPSGVYAAGESERSDKYSNGTGVLKINIKPDKKIKIALNGYANAGKTEDFPGFGTYAPKDRQNETSNLYMGKGAATYTFDNDISVELSSYYWYYEAHHDFIFSFNSAENDLIQNINDYNENRMGTKLIIKQPDNFLNLQWILGYSFSRTGVGDDSRARLRGEESKVVEYRPPIKYAGYEREVNSVFTQFKWGVVEKSLYLLAGSRFDDYSDIGRQVTPRGGIIFLPTEKSSVKALYGRAFRAPAGMEMKGTDYYYGNPDIKPEQIDCYELIFMYKDKNLKASLNTFYSRWFDAIETDADDLVFKNISESRSMGGEADIFYNVNPLAFELGFAYVRSEKIDVDDPENPGEKTDIEYSAFPEYSIRAGIHYTGPLGFRYYLNNRVYLNMGQDTSENPDELPPYWRIDLDISKIVAEKLEVHLNCRNLLNRENRVAGIWHNTNTSLVYDSDGLPEVGTSVMLRAVYRI